MLDVQDWDLGEGHVLVIGVILVMVLLVMRLTHAIQVHVQKMQVVKRKDLDNMNVHVMLVIGEVEEFVEKSMYV